MGLTNSDYEAVMREYDSIRYENAELLHNRTKAVYDKIPEIKELEDEVITDFANLAKEALFLSNESYTSSKEELDKKANMEEFMFLGLRLTRGVSRHEFNEKFGIDMFELYDRQIKRNIMLNLMEYNSPYLRLTDKGLDLSNMVMSDFLLD